MVSVSCGQEAQNSKLIYMTRHLSASNRVWSWKICYPTIFILQHCTNSLYSRYFFTVALWALRTQKDLVILELYSTKLALNNFFPNQTLVQWEKTYQAPREKSQYPPAKAEAMVRFIGWNRGQKWIDQKSHRPLSHPFLLSGWKPSTPR